MQKPEYKAGLKEGQYTAVIFQYIELGKQRFSNANREWFSPQVMIGFDIPSENLIKSQTYFLSLSPSRNGQFGYRELADAIAGHELSDEEAENYVPDMIGAKLLLTVSSVESKGQMYVNITKAEKYEGEVVSDRNPVVFEIDKIEEQFDVFESLPEFIQDKIRSSREYKTKFVADEQQPAQNSFASQPIPTEIPTINLDEEKPEFPVEAVPF